MASFDPTQPIQDASVWYPKGMYVKKEPTEANSDTEVLVLGSSDIAKLNRYVWTSKLLPTTRDAYTMTLGIVNTGEISNDVWSAADKVLNTYATMKSDSSDFLENLWPSTVDLANDIYNYSVTAGGKAESSYYANMLSWIGEYNKVQGTSDADMYLQSIKELTDREVKNIDGMYNRAETVKQGLGKYHDKCKTSKGELDGYVATMNSLLEGDDGEIEKWKHAIDEIQKDIEEKKADIDYDRLVIKWSAAYAWIPFGGMIAGIAVDIAFENKIKGLEEDLKKLRDTLNQDEAKLEAALKLHTDINAMNDQLGKLVDVISPAITAIETIQGAWEAMGSDLKQIGELVEDEGKNLPPMLLAKTDLEGIVERWNTLAQRADIYRQMAYLSEDPTYKSLDDYLNDLEEAESKK
ncbi:hypothetical protein BDV25DRAFT_141847 [Aspergillus avenaceus]|uniref:Uncharacterized protein n=1 Tax=Aspergillus avenaceus TaxID=36643 RepID=A0A5N6TPX1_ASPAV|nr:hypothetical protein BDV25DRAFT_141847 [Aspergillus avenaceus]